MSAPPLPTTIGTTHFVFHFANVFLLYVGALGKYKNLSNWKCTIRKPCWVCRQHKSSTKLIFTIEIKSNSLILFSIWTWITIFKCIFRGFDDTEIVVLILLNCNSTTWTESKSNNNKNKKNNSIYTRSNRMQNKTRKLVWRCDLLAK